MLNIIVHDKFPQLLQKTTNQLIKQFKKINHTTNFIDWNRPIKIPPLIDLIIGMEMLNFLKENSKEISIELSDELTLENILNHYYV